MNTTSGKVKYINSNNFVSKEENFEVSDSIFPVPAIPDKLRYFSKKYWSFDKNGIKVSDQLNNLISFRIVNDNTIELFANLEKFSPETIENGILTKKFNVTSWRNFLEEGVPTENEVFQDFYFEFSEPKNISEAAGEIETGGSFINREFIYQFKSAKYENLVNDPVFDTNYLPNIFNVLGDKRIDIRSRDENLRLSLGGFIESYLVDSLSISRDVNDNLKTYFDRFADVFNKPEVSLVRQTILQEQQNLLIEKNKLEALENTKFIPYPFYLKTQFTNESNKKTSLIHVLDSIGNLQNELMIYLDDVSQFNTQARTNFIFPDLSEKTINLFDFKLWLRSGFGEFTQGGDVPQTPEKSIKYSQLVDYIAKNFKDKARKYKDIFDKSSYHETILFKIEKRLFANSAPIQTFWVVPTNKEILNFIDTQIKYGTQYNYKIYAYTLLVGTEYSYRKYNYSELEKETHINSGRFFINVDTKPVYKIAEVPFAEINGAIYEAPYTKPKYKLQLQGESVRFNFMQSSLEELEEPEFIENGDYILLENIRKSQDNTQQNKILSRINKNNYNVLEIFRTTIRPVNFLSFQGKLYKKILLNSNDSSFLDTLVPGIKYFYTFRFVNSHSVPSNPSEVISVVLNNEDGLYSLAIDSINLKEQSPKIFEKNMKKYLLIRPSVIQTQPNFQDVVNTVEDVNLGPNRQKAWNKNFIIKIKSNKTNKLLYFNITPIINKKKQ